MQFKIKANTHRARPLQVKLWWDKTALRRVVCFDFNCKYDIGIDQSDWNKLFGIAFIPLWKAPMFLLWSISSGLLFRNLHHKNSARFVWRYNPDNQMIDIGYYCYVDGKRASEKICSIPFQKNCRLELIISYRQFVFAVYNQSNVLLADVSIGYNKIGNLSYQLGGYFGGNRKAPHRMSYLNKEV